VSAEKNVLSPNQTKHDHLSGTRGAFLFCILKMAKNCGIFVLVQLKTKREWSEEVGWSEIKKPNLIRYSKWCIKLNKQRNCLLYQTLLSSWF